MQCQATTSFPLDAVPGTEPRGLRGGRRQCYHSATVAPLVSYFIRVTYTVLMGGAQSAEICNNRLFKRKDSYKALLCALSILLGEILRRKQNNLKQKVFYSSMVFVSSIQDILINYT